MKPLGTILPIAAVTLAAGLGLAAGAAWADGRDNCAVPMADWQPREKVAALAAEMGWAVRRIKIDDGCYEVVGMDKDGRKIEAQVHPASLTVMGIEYEDDDREHEGEHENGHQDEHEDGQADN